MKISDIVRKLMDYHAIWVGPGLYRVELREELFCLSFQPRVKDCTLRLERAGAIGRQTVAYIDRGKVIIESSSHNYWGLNSTPKLLAILYNEILEDMNRLELETIETHIFAK